MCEAVNLTQPIEPTQISQLQEKVGWICRLVRRTSVLWTSSKLALTLWVWLHREEFLTRLAVFVSFDPESVTDIAYWSALAVSLAGWGVSAVLVVAVWRLMGGYLEGEIFTVRAANRLRLVALAGFAASAAGLFSDFLAKALISTSLIAEAPAAWIGPEYFLYFLICGFLLALAAIFRTAAEIAAEHAQFI